MDEEEIDERKKIVDSISAWPWDERRGPFY